MSNWYMSNSYVDVYQIVPICGRFTRMSATLESMMFVRYKLDQIVENHLLARWEIGALDFSDGLTNAIIRVKVDRFKSYA